MKHALNMRAHGFTLAEVLIALSVSSVMSLALVMFLSRTNENAMSLQRQGEFNRDSEAFVYALEQYMSQTTQVVACGCEADSTPCRNTSFNEAVGDGSSVFTFVHENASNPLSWPTAGCLENNAGATPPALAGSTVRPLGCKRVVELRYTKPTRTDGTTFSAPGKLELVWTRPSGAPNTAAGTVLAQLVGVTRFSCSMTANAGADGIIGTSDDTLSNSELTMHIEAKTRNNNVNNTSDNSYETWSPDPADTKASTFRRGLHRTNVVQVSFRNLTVPGVQFGKLRQVRKCKEDGESASSYLECCSNYRDPNASVCVAATSCIHNPGTAAAPSAPAGSIDQCCSHMMSAGACI